MVHGGAYQHGVGVARRWGAEIDLGAAQRLQGCVGVAERGKPRFAASACPLEYERLLRRLRSTSVRRCVLEESAARASSPRVAIRVGEVRVTTPTDIKPRPQHIHHTGLVEGARATTPMLGPMSEALQLHRATLDNGMRVVVNPDTTSPGVAVNMWYRVGVGRRGTRPFWVRPPLSST